MRRTLNREEVSLWLAESMDSCILTVEEFKKNFPVDAEEALSESLFEAIAGLKVFGVAVDHLKHRMTVANLEKNVARYLIDAIAQNQEPSADKAVGLLKLKVVEAWSNLLDFLTNNT